MIEELNDQPCQATSFKISINDIKGVEKFKKVHIGGMIHCDIGTQVVNDIEKQIKDLI